MADPNELVRCYRVTLEGSGSTMYLKDDSLDYLESQLRALDVDAKPALRIAVIEMRRGDLESMGEFDGW